MLQSALVSSVLITLVALVTGAPVNQAIIFGSDTPSGAAAVTGLAGYKVPYIAYDTTASLASTSLPLNAGSTANFSMIILGSGTIGFSAAQWKQLYDYQELNGARLVALYDSASLGLSASYMGPANTTSRILTPVGSAATTSAGLPASYSLTVSAGFGDVYPGTIQNATVVSPVLTFEAGVIGAAVYTISPNRQQLSFFYQIAAWDTTVGGLSKSTTEIFISWASKGTYGYKPPAPYVAHVAQVQTRALILSPGSAEPDYWPQTAFRSYGLDYDIFYLPAANASTFAPNLEVTANSVGRYSIIVLSNGLIPGFTAMNKIYEYQQFYGVRLIVNGDLPVNYAGKLAALNAATQCVRTTLNLKPASNAFTDPAGLTSTWSLPSADGIVEGSYNCPATITNATAVTPVLNFESGGVAAAVIDFGNNQQQMSFFLPCADWSGVCTTIANIWFQWGTRGAYTGLRRIYFTPQIDDVFLKTDGNDETGKAVAFRISQADIQGLIAWTPQINSRLPKGSNITIEMAYNGNGIMEYLSRLPTNPGYLIDIDPDLTDTGLDWKKPLGTGKTLWPAKANYTWTKANLALDPIYNAFSGPGNLAAVTSKFLWCSHTFTHEIFNNNSYSDTFKEVDFNFHLASKDLWGLDGQPFWSNKSMVTPGISGIFNGDALKALLDFGITGVVGDASRPKTVDPVRPLWWPITTNVADNGYAGMTVVPRQSLNIYFNTTNGPYNAQLYNNIYGTTKTFADILVIEVARNMRTLPMLSWQPAMFHQANLRNADMPNVTINGVSGKFSLMQQWVESVFGSFAKIANWPIITLKQDDLTQKFINRKNYETAGVNVVQLLGINATGVSIVGFNVTASKNCIAPVTLPPTVAIKDIILPAGATTEQIGVDSVTVWVPLAANAAPVQIKFGTLPVIPTTTTTTTTTSTTTSTTTTIPTTTTTSTTTTTPTTSTTPATSTISTTSTKSTTSTSVSTSTISTSSTITMSTIVTSASISKTTTTSTLPACYPAWVSQDYDGPAKVSYLKNNYNVGAGGEGADAIPGGDTLWVLEGPCDSSAVATTGAKTTTSARASSTTTVLATTSSSLTTVTKSASPTTSVVQTATVIPKTTTTAKLPACYAAWVNNIDYDEPANVSYLKKNYKVGAGGEGAGVVPGGDNLWLLEGDCV